MRRKKKTFRMPYGSIALGGVFAMGASFFVPHDGILMFIIGLLVVVVAFTCALCRALDGPGGFWPFGWF